MKLKSLYNIYIFSIILVTFLIDFMYSFMPEFRYLRYIGIPLFFIAILYRSKIKDFNLNDRAKPFLLLIFISVLYFPILTQQGIFELIFLFAGISMFLFPPQFDIDVKIWSSLSIFLFVVFYSWQGTFNFTIDSLLDSSTSSIEGGYSFIFGFFAIYFWEKRKYLYFFLNLFFLILALKRIVLIGVLAVILLTVLPRRWYKIFTNKFILIGANIIFIFVIQIFSEGYFDDLIREYTGYSPGKFTGGRNMLYSLVLNNNQNDGLSLIYGIGQGGTANILAQYYGHIFLLHNDILKIVVEYGYIVLVIFLILLYKNKNEKILRLTVFLNILYLTDNPLIYQSVFMLYLLLCHVYARETENESYNNYKSKPGDLQLSHI